MGGEVVVKEELAAHEVEGEVMCRPGEPKEASGVVQSASGTAVESVDTSALSELICANDSGKDSKDGRSNPPSCNVAKEVDLFSCVALCPETNSAHQEGPLNWLGRVRVGRGKGIIVMEHGSLKFKILFEEREMLDFLGLLVVAFIFGWDINDRLAKPDVTLLGNVLVAINFLLLVSPVWKRLRVGPHCYL